MSFVSELKRRKVFQVAAVYLVVAWLIMQVVDVVNEPLRLPEWFATVAILIVAIGFPIALILSWAFDLTPEGVVKDQGSGVTAQSSGRRIEYVLIGLLVLAVGWIGFREVNPPASSAGVLPNSVAVLPFEDLSLDPENAFFAPGIHDTILNELAKIADMNVIARTSVLRYADGQTPVSQIADELNVETIMEGTVQYAEGQVRITAQLIDPETGLHLWSGNYDRNFADIFVIQSEIATRIAMALEAELLPAELESIEQRPTQSDAAFALYLKARALIPNLSGGAARLEFLDPLNQALTLDSEFALARATLAFVYAAASGRRESGSAEGEEMETLARDHAQKALAVDPNQGLAYAALAFIDENYGRVPESQINWEKALESSPNDTDVLDDAVRFYSFTGQLDKARPLAARAYSLNPAQFSTQNWLHVGSKDFDAHAASRRQEIQEDPTSAGSAGDRITIGLAEALRNNSQAALEELQLAEELDPDFPNNYSFSRAIYAYGRIGRTDDAQRLFERFQALANDESFAVSPSHLVRANLGIGDQEEALRWLNIIAETPGRRSSLLNGPIIWNLYSDPILDQPEFVEVRSRLGFRE